MPEKAAQDGNVPEQELHAVDVEPAEAEAGPALTAHIPSLVGEPNAQGGEGG
ncbi:MULTISPECIES: hypothetical protein [unclassified Streptomyces]|uniref:hypothetical protein n=1 Tax=unclassified Streptomyces TaxID=2593676 RepID=UPI0013311F09|nr:MULTISPECIES: hypothetical protein [unclassified Streptomyces]MCP3771008.1 hypothetical protein [Streptomyces sp. MAR25Y5]